MSRNRTRTKRPTLAKPTPIAGRNVALLERERPPDEPILFEAARSSRTTRKASKNATSKAFSLAWDETEAMGITADMRRSGPGMLSDQDRKETLYQAYLNSVWISACVDVIAKRITSGGMVIEITEQGTENQAEYNQLHDFLHYINEDEDFLQLIRSIATDLLIYGECYMEIVRGSDGKPYSLHKIDCITMNYKLDQHGNVIEYIQNMTHSTETVSFSPDDVVRWWLPDPKANKKALSPIERILGSVDADAHMADWVRAFFRKGARPPFWIKYPGSKEEASRFVAWLRENYTGQANAHVPMVLYDEAEMYEVGKGSVDMDFLKGREQMRQEILAGYQVPPAIVSQIESGNIGGGTGDSQEKSFQFNACDPLRQLIFEKFNYKVVNKGFGITNWRVNTRYGDYRSDDMVAKIQDMNIRNGSVTINEVRAETGKKPVPGGDENVIVTTKEIQPVDRLSSLSDEQSQQTQVSIQQAQAQLEMTKAQVDKLKNSPPPPPVVMQPGGQQGNTPPQQSAQKQPPQQPAQGKGNNQGKEEEHIQTLSALASRLNETLTRAEMYLNLMRGTQDYPVIRGDQHTLPGILPFNAMIAPKEKINDVPIVKNDYDSPPPETPIEPSGIEKSSTLVQVKNPDYVEEKQGKTDSHPALQKGWRPPSDHQLHLEKQLQGAIHRFIQQAHIQRDGVTLPDESDHDQLLETFDSILTQAIAEGKRVATGKAQEGVLPNAAKNLAGHIVQVIGDIVTQLKEQAQSFIDRFFGDGATSDTPEQDLEHAIDEWSDEYSNMVAQTEVHAAVEGAVIDSMQDDGIERVNIHAEPDACVLCKENAEGSPYPISEASDHLGLHPRCRCTSSDALEE